MCVCVCVCGERRLISGNLPHFVPLCKHAVAYGTEATVCKAFKKQKWGGGGWAYAYGEITAVFCRNWLVALSYTADDTTRKAGKAA